MLLLLLFALDTFNLMKKIATSINNSRKSWNVPSAKTKTKQTESRLGTCWITSVTEENARI